MNEENKLELLLEFEPYDRFRKDYVYKTKSTSDYFYEVMEKFFEEWQKDNKKK